MKLYRLFALLIIVFNVTPAFAKKANPETEARPSYKTRLEEKRQARYVTELQKALNELYFKNAPKEVLDNETERQRVDAEARRIAEGVIPEIARLKKKYRLFPLPAVHNMMISVGLKKRGACKHWAEDLLTYLRTVKRDYFYVSWGEANPTEMHEHNVAVLFPKYSDFYQGMMIDPWRTAGKPFWRSVMKDPHYKWNPWEEYGVY